MEFQKTTLGELSVGGKGSYGIAASAVPYSENLFTFLRITDINDDGTLNKSGLMSVDDKKASQYLLKPNDIVFARTGGSTGRNYFYDGTDGEFVFAGFLIKFSIDEIKVNPRFVKYYCLSQDYKNWVHSFNTGSTRGNINAQTYANMPMLLPPRELQDLLVDILSVIDRKIAINTAINENLEQQAYILLENMLSTPHDNMCCLSDIANINPRYTLSKGTEARYIDMSQLSTTTSFPNDWAFRGYNGGMKFRNKDTIMARITPCLENGKTAYIDFLDNDEIAFGSTEYIVLSSKNNTPPELLYCIVRYPEFRNYATVNMNGSSGRQRVSGEIIGKYELPLFSQEELAHFRSVVEPLFNQITENSLQNRNLSALRDTLLPKLMNGEIDISAVKI